MILCKVESVFLFKRCTGGVAKAYEMDCVIDGVVVRSVYYLSVVL